MAIKINFDAANNPEAPTIILAKKNGDKIGLVNAKSIEVSDNLNDASEISFTVNKYVDGNKDIIWDYITNFKAVYCVEWNEWFEITVEVDESDETVKTVSCVSLGPAELSQIMLYNIQINTEDDIARDEYDKDYPTVLYRKNDHPEASLLHRIMEKAPHYSIVHVDDTIANIQRTFEFDDTSIYDAFMEIAEEINCLFVFNCGSDSNGNIQRTISVYDLESNCKNQSCKYRGEFSDICPKCGGTDIDEGYGEDTAIFVTSDELADSIQYTTDTDKIKNCFKLEAGDDLVTATIRNCNPNGTDYIWYLSDDMKADMSDELVKRIDDYDVQYSKYYNDEEYMQHLDGVDVGKYNDIVEKYNDIYMSANNEELSKMPDEIVGYPALMDIYYNAIDIKLYLESGLMPTVEIGNDTTAIEEAKKLTHKNMSPVATNDIKSISKATADSIVKAMAKVYVDTGKYKIEIKSSELDKSEFVPYWYGTIYLENYSSEEDEENGEMKDSATVKFVKESSTEESDNDKNLIIIKKGIAINDNYELITKQSIDKLLAKDDTEDMSIAGLFEKEIIVAGEGDNVEYSGEFVEAIKNYSLNRLSSFYDACQSCIDILTEQQIPENNTWGKNMPPVCNNEDCGYVGDNIEDGKCPRCGEDNIDYNANLYDKLYLPYTYKLAALSREIEVRQDEIDFISGVYDSEDNLIEYGVINYIEKVKSIVNSALDFEDYIGEYWQEFCIYRREDKYSNDNYISDGLNNAELIKKAQEFIETAQKEIYKSSELQHSISADLNNLLVIDKFKPIVNSFKVGNWIRAMVDDKIYKFRLIGYKIDYDDLDGISVEFSDTTKVNSSAKSIQGVIQQASSMATSYSSVKRQAKQGEDSKSTINSWFENGLDATNTKIIGGSDNQSQTWDNHGMLFRKFDSDINDYEPTQMKIINSTLAITDDNWNTIKTAIGKFYRTNDKGELEASYGVNAETIIGQLILGKNLVLDNGSGNMTFDDSGLVITNNNGDKLAIDPREDTPIFTISTNKSGEDKSLLSFNDGSLVITGDITASSLTLIDGATVDSGNVAGLSKIALNGSYTNLIGDSSKSGHVLQLDGNGGVSVSSVPLKKVATSGSYTDLSDTPNLSTVATSGSYTDLTGSTLDAEKLLYVGTDGKITSITIDELKIKLGIS